MKTLKTYIVWLKRFHSRYGSVREVKSDCELTARELCELFPNYIAHFSIDNLSKLIDEDYQLKKLSEVNNNPSFNEISMHLSSCLDKLIDALNRVKCINFTKYFNLPKGIEIPNKVNDFLSMKVTRSPSGLKIVGDSGLKL